MEKEFILLARDIIRSEDFQKTKNQRHHVRGTVYGHSLKVAYLCYRHHKLFHMKMDARELVTGALLHDFYLYDRQRKDEKHRFHWLRHPRTALENAKSRYPLTDAQQDMIRRHMFPVTPVPPKTKAGWLVCFYDKVAAVDDRFG
ncbi:MAG: HD domain-containing protein [Clostridia bacterium]|nr:HD domain-containing protein [Clostridia bacterium]